MKKARRKAQYILKTNLLEEYKILLITLEALMYKSNIKTIAFTELSDIEDKTRHVFNIANLMAKEDKKVLLLECSIKDPDIEQVLEKLNEQNTNNNIGNIPNLHVYISGQKLDDSEYVLNITNIEIILEAVKDKYDIVIINTPPVGYCADGIKLCAAADGTIIIIRTGDTPVEMAINSKKILELAGAKVLGVLMQK